MLNASPISCYHFESEKIPFNAVQEKNTVYLLSNRSILSKDLSDTNRQICSGLRLSTEFLQTHL